MNSTQPARNLVVLITKGPHDERASVGFTIANGGITSGLDMSIFLTADGIDIVRRGAADTVQSHPFDNLRELIEDFIQRGGTVWACTPCVKARGYTQDDLVDGVIITGASPMHAKIAEGAGTLSF